MKILITILVLAVAAFIVHVRTDLFKKGDCSYVLPDGFKIVYNKNTGMYAIRTRVADPVPEAGFQIFIPSIIRSPYVDSYFGEDYNNYTYKPFTSTESFVEYAYLYSDSCKAKYAVKEYNQSIRY